MTHDEHAPFREKLPAYALGALDADESAALETHLETCASCRTELAEYRALSQSLLTAVPPRQPPATLRKRLQNQLPSAQQSSRPQWNFSFSRPALGLAVIALFILNLFSFVQLRQIQDQQTRLLDQVGNAQVAMALLSSPNLQMLRVSGDNVSGTVLLNNEQNQAVLIVQNLPVPEKDKTYQIWLIKPDGGRVSAGLFRPETGMSYTTQPISSSGSFSDYLGIGVTVEPAGGSDAPTGERVLKVDF
jgi:anti-sigma-K factor RskA